MKTTDPALVRSALATLNLSPDDFLYWVELGVRRKHTRRVFPRVVIKGMMSPKGDRVFVHEPAALADDLGSIPPALLAIVSVDAWPEEEKEFTEEELDELLAAHCLTSWEGVPLSWDAWVKKWREKYRGYGSRPL